MPSDIVTATFQMNKAPVADAGTNIVVRSGYRANLCGAASDDDLPGGELKYEWTVVSASGRVKIDDTGALDTVVRFGAPGAYVLRLTVNDGMASASDDISIRVYGNTPPATTKKIITVSPTSTGNVPETRSRACGRQLDDKGKKMKLDIKRCDKNPIVYPGIYSWRKAVVFNPAVIIDHGKFYMIERAAGSVSPNICFFGLLESSNGVDFMHVKDYPVFTAKEFGYHNGSVQDSRLVKIDDTFYMTYALRKYPGCKGIAVDYPEKFLERNESNETISGIAKSKDLIHWEQIAYTSEEGLDDRDHILFPEKVDGKYVLLRRPMSWIGPKYGVSGPSIWISYSDDLVNWSKPKLLAQPKFKWEDGKIGGSTPPIKTDDGWLLLYHGVESYDNWQHEIKYRGHAIYRIGFMLLDLKDPSKVLYRTPHAVMEPSTYYERVGLIIPDVIFPCGNVVKDGRLFIYYGCCDTSIGLATVSVSKLLKFLKNYPA